MTLRTYTIQKKDSTHSQVWEWEETEELVALLQQLHTINEVKDGEE